MVSNYPGATVEKHSGKIQGPDGNTVQVTDLPGTYSIYPRSLDEQVAFEVLANDNNPDHPDLCIVVVDASNLKRNLLLCTQVIDLGIPVVIALNMIDIASNKGIEIDEKGLSKALNVPVVPINVRKGEGIAPLKEAMFGDRSSTSFLNMETLFPGLGSRAQEIYKTQTDYKAILVAGLSDRLSFIQENQKIEFKSLLKDTKITLTNIQGAETLKRYEKINDFLNGVHRLTVEKEKNISERIDRFLTHPVYGYLSFLLILFLIFQAIFTFAQYPMDLISQGFVMLSGWLYESLPDHFLSRLLIEGIVAGISGIAVFIPQIVILFGLISILEDTGYMSRVSFIMDRLMRSVGMSGKSVVPLVSGVACAIPAIMATRNIDNWKERIITILVTPLMSCSARLPIYTLIIAMIVPDENIIGIFNLQGIALMGMYCLGLVAAMAVSWILSKILKSDYRGIFILELPVYRTPRWGNVAMTMYQKAKIFTLEAGKVILVISIILWGLSSYGPGNAIQQVELTYQKQLQEDPDNTDLINQIQSEKLTHSYAGKLGKLIEPVIIPLGFDWKMGIALITSFAAREVFVGTMATIYAVGGNVNNLQPIRQRMEAEIKASGEKVYGFATGISLMIFYAFAMQCMSTLAIVRKETRSWKWPLIQVGYMTTLAYVASLITYQILK